MGRSLRNGLLISLLSALLISVIGVLSEALSVGVSYGLGYALTGVLIGVLSYGVRDALNDALSLLFPGIVVMWALSGGLTVLRHYVIRWLLARHRIFPFRAKAFLDDTTMRILLRRVGGGYSFIHRRLQDYFADTVIPPPQK